MTVVEGQQSKVKIMCINGKKGNLWRCLITCFDQIAHATFWNQCIKSLDPHLFVLWYHFPQVIYLTYKKRDCYGLFFYLFINTASSNTLAMAG